MRKVLCEVEDVFEFFTGRPSAGGVHARIERAAEVETSGMQDPLRNLCSWINSTGLVGEERRMRRPSSTSELSCAQPSTNSCLAKCRTDLHGQMVSETIPIGPEGRE